MTLQPEHGVSREESIQLAQIMNLKYAAARRQRYFSIKAAVDGPWATISVVLESADQSFYYPVDGRVLYKTENIDAKSAILLMADYIDAYFEEFFREDENVFIPIDWSHFQFEGINLQLKGQVLNLVHEQAAEELLAGRKE